MLRSDLFSKTVVRVREVGQWREGKPPVPAPNPFCQGTPCRPAGAKPQVCLLAVTKGYQIETGRSFFSSLQDLLAKGKRVETVSLIFSAAYNT